jgi:hypothetical protein
LKFANENKKLNHEKVEDREITSLIDMVHQMVACTFRNRALKFKGKRGVLGKILGKITMTMVKALLPTYIYFLPFLLIFILFYSSNLMPDSRMSVTFCRYNDFEVQTKEYRYFLFFNACLIVFYGF